MTQRDPAPIEPGLKGVLERVVPLEWTLAHYDPSLPAVFSTPAMIGLMEMATSHVIRQRRANAQTLLSLEELEHLPDRSVDRSAADTHRALERLFGLIPSLKPQDRRVILSHRKKFVRLEIALR